jgi:transposase InsO family protein
MEIISFSINLEHIGDIIDKNLTELAAKKIKRKFQFSDEGAKELTAFYHASRQVLHVHVTPNPTASWAAQQMVECCAWDRKPPRFLVHDRDSRYGPTFDRRMRRLGITQARTPVRSPRTNALAERWVRSVRTECLDHVFIFNECHLVKVLTEYVGYLNPSSERPSLYVVEENRFC